jgi:hypothetical protein
MKGRSQTSYALTTKGRAAFQEPLLAKGRSKRAVVSHKEVHNPITPPCKKREIVLPSIEKAGLPGSQFCSHYSVMGESPGESLFPSKKKMLDFEISQARIIIDYFEEERTQALKGDSVKTERIEYCDKQLGGARKKIRLAKRKMVVLLREDITQQL